MTTRRFEHSFHPKTKPTAGEPCALKWHYSGVMRELVGYFDNMAAIDPGGERFVFTSVAYLLKQGKLKRYKGAAYSESAIRHALAELRARRIISSPVERERWMDARPRKSPDEVVPQVLRKLTGSIVALHDCIAHTIGDECHFVGPMKLCGRWERVFHSEPAKLVADERVFANAPAGALYWNGCAQHAPATGGLPNGRQMLAAPNAAQSAGPIAGHCAEHCAEWCAEPIAKPDSDQSSDVVEDSGQNGGQAVVTVIPGVSRENREEPDKPIEPAPLVQAAAQIQTGASRSSSPSGACAPYGHDVTKTTGSEITIGQRFQGLDDMELLTEISDGEFNAHAYKQTGEIETLAGNTRMVVEEIAGLPWDNLRTTCADIMDTVARRIRRADLRYPKGWFAVFQQLRQKGGTCSTKYTPPVTSTSTGWGDLSAIRASLRAHGGKYPNNTAWEMCGDGIKRIASSREAEGFTVLAADGIWDKP
jgi:hypothetical protein